MVVWGSRCQNGGFDGDESHGTIRKKSPYTNLSLASEVFFWSFEASAKRNRGLVKVVSRSENSPSIGLLDRTKFPWLTCPDHQPPPIFHDKIHGNLAYFTFTFSTKIFFKKSE